MTLYTYGGGPADVITDAAGNVIPDYPLNVRMADSGELISALFEADGTTPIDQLRSNPSSSPTPGAIRAFKCSATAIDFEHLDSSGSPVRWYAAGREVPTAALQTAADAATAAAAKLDRGAGGTVTGDVAFSGPAVFTGAVDFAGADVTGLPMLQRWISVLDHGAVGDGITDDVAAIQAACDQAYTAGGGVVVLPPGYAFAVSTFIVVRAGTTLVAYGATIRSVHATTGCLRNFYGTDSFAGYTGHSHIRVYGGTWDGNAYNAVDGTGIVTATTNIMTFIHCQDIVVKDARFVDTSSAHALELNAVSGARVESCRFEGFIDNSGDGSRATSEWVEIDIAKSGNAAIGDLDGTPCRDVVFQSCWFGPSARLGSAGRAIGSHGAVLGHWYERITIRDCQIWGTSADVGIRAMYWRDSVITGNVISGTAKSGVLAATDPTVTQDCYGLVIEGNIIESPAADAGIWVDGISGGVFADVVVRGNVVRSSGGYGIRADYATGIVISGNRSNTSTQGGILVQESPRATVTGNSLTAAGSNGINAAGSAYSTITGNTIDGTTANHGISVGASTSAGGYATIAGNLVRGAASAGIRLTAPGSTATGNRVSKDSGTTANGVSLSSGATGCTVTGNDLTGNGWAPATAIVTGGAAPITDARGGTGLPGGNPLNALATAVATAANTTAATAVATATIPAADAVAGAVYRLIVRGTASTTGTPTLALDVQLGGTSLFASALRAAAATASSLASSSWECDVLLGCLTTGTTGTWWAKATLTDRLTAGGSGTPAVAVGMTASTGTTKDTTTAQALTFTATWGTASASNTISATSATLERVG